jgi:hypothetical protein
MNTAKPSNLTGNQSRITQKYPQEPLQNLEQLLVTGNDGADTLANTFAQNLLQNPNFEKRKILLLH